MFSALVSFLAGQFSWFRSFFSDSKEKGDTWLGLFFGAVVIFAGWVFWFWDFLKGSLSHAVGLLDSLSVPTLGAPGGTFVTWLSVANTFFPVSEMFGFFVAYLVLLAALLTFKVGRKAVAIMFGL